MADCVVFMNPVPSKAPQISAFKFLKVISPCYDKVSIVSSSLDDTDDAQVVNIRYKKQSNKILRVLNFVWFQLKAFFKSLKVLKKGDVAFFWVGDKMFSSMLACKLKRVRTHFFLYGMTSLENVSKKAQNTKKSQDYLAKKADFVCAESKSVLLDRGITEDKNTKIIHLYVDDLKKSSDKKNTVGMLCRLASGKCVLEAIEGFCAFHEKYNQYNLEIVGDGILYDECKQLIEKHNASEYIRLCGWVLHDELFTFMPKWKLLLFPTKTEGLPNSVLESMSMGIPVLCSFVGGLKDLIQDGQNGYVLECDTPSCIEKSLCSIFEDETQLCAISQQAKQTVENEYTLQKARENFVKQMGY